MASYEPSAPLSPFSSAFPSASSSSSSTDSSPPLLPTHTPTMPNFPINIPNSSSRPRPHRPQSDLGLRRISNPVLRLKPTSLVASFASRIFRILKSRDALTLILFVSSLFYFFSALCGVGYVDPNPSSVGLHTRNESLPEFALAKPLLSQPEVEGGKSQKELEESWQKMARKNDGAWLRPKRIDRRHAVVGSEDTEELDREVVSDQ